MVFKLQNPVDLVKFKAHVQKQSKGIIEEGRFVVFFSATNFFPPMCATVFRKKETAIAFIESDIFKLHRLGLWYILDYQTKKVLQYGENCKGEKKTKEIEEDIKYHVYSPFEIVGN